MELNIDDDFKNLIRPLYKDEFKELESLLLKEGITNKLVVWDKTNTIVDGHNRYEIAKKHNLKFEVDRRHFLSKEDAINWMISNQLGRRNLTPEQRHQIFTDAEDVIKGIYEKGKKKMESTLKKGTDTPLGPNEPSGKPPHNTNKEIGKMIGMSRTQVTRMNKVKRESPELYDEVVKGEKTASGAYKELPSVKENIGKGRGANKVKNEFIDNREGGDANEVGKVENADVPSRNQKPPKLTKKEIEKELFDADVSNLFMHLGEVSGFVWRTENLESVINEAMRKDEATMVDYIKSLKTILEITKVEAM